MKMFAAFCLLTALVCAYSLHRERQSHALTQAELADALIDNERLDAQLIECDK